MEATSFIILIFFGMLGGFLSGLLGVGGGIIFIPIISFFIRPFDLEAQEYVRYLLANSFATIFFAGVISTYKQYRIQQFYPKQILITASLAVVSSTVVTYLITAQSWYSKRAFSIVFLALLVFTVFRFVYKKPSHTNKVKETPSIKYLITGFLTGIVTSLSGLGGGVIMIPLFNQYIKIDMKSSSAISIGVIPLILIPVLVTYLISSPLQLVQETQMGYILPELFLPMVAGLLFAAPIGVASAQKTSDKVLKIIFASLVIIVIINTIVSIVK
ncbi:MAG: sulfite exporter TauE/SafE family protein [Bacteroidia bacterium]